LKEASAIGIFAESKAMNEDHINSVRPETLDLLATKGKEKIFEIQN
jgi:hypothetical protein